MTKGPTMMLALGMAVTAGCGSPEGGVPTTPTPTSSNTVVAVGFTSDQAARGRATFRQICRECHYVSEFRGADFEWQWRRRTAWDLFRNISRNMPENAPGSLTQQVYTDVVAYVLALNQHTPGDTALAPTREAMSQIPIDGAVKTGGRDPVEES